MKTRLNISIPKLREKSKNRPEGYVEEVLSKGTVQGEKLFITHEAYSEVLQKYNPTSPNVVGTCCAGSTPPPRPRPRAAVIPFPPLREQAKNLIGATGRAARAVLTGQPLTLPQEEIDRRKTICNGCEFLKGNRCGKCGCVYQAKIRLKTEKCPVGKW